MVNKVKNRGKQLQLEGQIVDIRYKNEINSYTVATFVTNEKEETTVIGYLPFVNIGDNIKILGNIVSHPDYGEQFKIETFEKQMPSTPEALEKYLANGTFKGIGPAMAKKIVTAFGNDTINIIKLEPEKLTKIKGITKEKALEIAEQFLANWEIWQIVGFLNKFGIGPQSAESVYKKIGESALEKIGENPYILIDVASKVNFEKVDKVALELGIEQRSYTRIRSGIKYALEKIALNGNSAVLYDNLIKFVQELLKIDIDSIENAIISMKAKQEIVIEEREEDSNIQEWVYSSLFYNAERNIAEKLIGLRDSENIKEIKSLKSELKEIEKEIDIELSEKQREAIESINNNNVCIITGGPGTGKTTIIKAIIELYKKHGKKPVLCAPTGRAAKRMTETTGEEAKTLHRLLELIGISEEDNFNAEMLVTPIDGDIIIVDEASMLDMFLMNYLVKAIYKGTKLVLVGDIDQLPSVGPGSVLKDIIESQLIYTITLNQIFRQAAKSKIIVNAHRVNEGEGFIGGNVKQTNLNEEEKIELLDDFFYINETNQDKIQETVVSLCKGRLKAYEDFDFFSNIQVITPTKKGKLGTRELNTLLQNQLNPEEADKNERKFGEIVFREQDRVMQIKNNYNILWEKENEREFKKELGNGIFNGEMGIIEKINKEEKTLRVRFDDGKIATYENTDLEQLEHAYTITVHKSQGSEFDVVILVLSNTAPMLLTRNLIYTAITRAKKLLIVIGAQGVVNHMIENNTTRHRNTGLKYKLINMQNNR